MRLGLVACVVLLGTGCGSAPPVTLAPDAQGVQADKLAAPAGARSLGPAEGSHGGGCGLFATRGTYDGALADLRNRAAELGGNYVQIDAVTEPHDDSGCTTGGYVIRGIVYFVPHGPLPAVVETAEPPRPGVCDPPCSPGFACQAGACIPVCNPPCEANEFCTRKRTCEPVAPAPSAAPPATSSAAAAAPDAGTTRDARAD
jgi:hypothetical protein